MDVTCDQLIDALEALAEGDVPDAESARHLHACSRCASALARARQVHRALEIMPAAAPPADFTAAVARRTRSLRWEAEQRFDWWFNAATIASLIVIALGVWGLLNLTGLSALTAGTVNFVGRSVPTALMRIKPQLSTYGLASLVVCSSLAVWWWLDHAGRPQRTA